MERILLLNSSIKEMNIENKQISFKNVCLDNIPNYIKEIYEILVKQIVLSNILLYEKNIDLFGLCFKFEEDVDKELILELDKENDFLILLEKIKDKKIEILNLDFYITLNPNIEELPDTIKNLVTSLCTCIKLEMDKILKQE